MKKYIIATIIALFIIGIVLAVNNSISFESVVGFSMSYKYFLYTLIIILLGIAVSFIGIPFFIFYLVLEIILCGFITYSFIISFSLKGLLFSLIYLIIFKIIIWFLLLLIGFYSIKLIKNNFSYLIKRFKEYKRNSKLYFKKMIIISSIILSYNLLMVIFGNKIINFFASYLLF